MAQNYFYPAAGSVSVSVGTPNNAPIPTSSVLIAGEAPNGNQQVVQTDSAGNLIVSPLTSSSTVTVVQPTGTNLHTVVDSGSIAVTSSALPTGASTSALQTSGNSSLTTIATNTTGVATAANQTTGNASLASIDTKTPTVGQKTSAASRPVVIASDQSAIPVTGAFFQATQPVSGTVTVTQATGTNLHTVVDGSVAVTGTFFQATQPISATTLPLPTGAATSSNQVSEIAILGQISTYVGGSAGFSNSPVRNVYSTTSATTGAFLQLVASTTAATNMLEIFDSSGQTLQFAIGAAGSEVVQFNIFPGGNGRVPYTIPVGSRISIKALSANATSGEIDINFYK